MRKRSCLNMRHLWRQVGHDIGLWDTGSSRNNGGIPQIMAIYMGKGTSKRRFYIVWFEGSLILDQPMLCRKGRLGLSENGAQYQCHWIGWTSTGNPYYVVNTRTNRPFGDGLYRAFMVSLGIYGIGFNTFIGGKKWWKHHGFLSISQSFEARVLRPAVLGAVLFTVSAWCGRHWRHCRDFWFEKTVIS